MTGAQETDTFLGPGIIKRLLCFCKVRQFNATLNAIHLLAMITGTIDDTCSSLDGLDYLPTTFLRSVL